MLVKNLNRPVHISDCRTPRVELGRATIFGKDAHLLSKYMHDEDNKYGVRVTNLRGDKRVLMGLTDRRKTSKNLVDSRKN